MEEILYIVMPAYNEEENIETVIREWYPVIERHPGAGRSRLVVVNDGSRDKTLAAARGLLDEFPMLEVADKPNGGHGAAVLYAYRYALAAGAEYIFQTDSDGQTLPEEFEAFWKERGEYAALIGSRNHREDGVSRIFVTKVLKLTLRLIFGLKVTDANTPFRLMKRELLEAYLPEVPEDFNLSNVLLTVLFLYHEEKVKFIPITFRPRQGGANSINLRRITNIGIRAVGDFREIRKKLRD